MKDTKVSYVVGIMRPAKHDTEMFEFAADKTFYYRSEAEDYAATQCWEEPHYIAKVVTRVERSTIPANFVDLEELT